VLELLESGRLLSAGGDPEGVATSAGPDTNVWFTLNSNSIGMINPANPRGGITSYAIPTPNSAPGPIAAGPQDEGFSIRPFARHRELTSKSVERRVISLASVRGTPSASFAFLEGEIG
jgi:hypothetical protein